MIPKALDKYEAKLKQLEERDSARNSVQLDSARTSAQPEPSARIVDEAELNARRSARSEHTPHSSQAQQKYLIKKLY